MKKSGLNLIGVKEFNRALILQLISTSSKTTRNNLAKASKLTSMTPVSYTHLDVYKRQTYTCSNTLKPPIVFIVTTTVKAGARSGNVIDLNCCHLLAPSIRAAS